MATDDDAGTNPGQELAQPPRLHLVDRRPERAERARAPARASGLRSISGATPRGAALYFWLAVLQLLLADNLKIHRPNAKIRLYKRDNKRWD